LITLSRDAFSREELEVQIPVLQVIFKNVRPPGATDQLAEKIYGHSIAIFWHRVFYKAKDEGKFRVLYLKIIFTDYIDYWQLTDFTFHTELKEIGLP